MQCKYMISVCAETDNAYLDSPARRRPRGLSRLLLFGSLGTQWCRQ